MRIVLFFYIFFLGSFLGNSLSAAEIAESTHPMVVREPFVPQSFDLGVAIGNAWSSSSYILVEGFMGFKVTTCGLHCFVYIDLDEKVAAQRGQTHYISTVGPRFQTYTDGSSWGPYLRPFVGTNHYIFSGLVQDFGVVGLGVGTFFFLHPSADLRMELSASAGPVKWVILSLGAVVKWRNF